MTISALLLYSNTLYSCPFSSDSLRVPCGNFLRQKEAYEVLNEKKLEAIKIFIRESEARNALIQIGPEVSKEFAELGDKTITTERFRDLTQIISLRLIEELNSLGAAPDQTIVVLPWRAALAFGLTFLDKGYKNFWHIGLYRDEKTLKPSVYYKNSWDLPDNINYKNIKVVISDPMLATGGTIIDVIERVKEMGIPPENIIVCSIVSAPEGIGLPQEGLLRRYPQVRIVTTMLGDHLNEKGYIVYKNGVECIGDFGDRYFANDDWGALVARWEDAGLFTPKKSQAFANRMRQLESIKNQL